MPPIEEIEAAADALEALFNERAYDEIPDESTAFLRTSDQLRLIADRRKPKPPKVFVEDFGGEYIVRVLPAGSETHAAVYVDMNKVYSLVRDRGNAVLEGTQVWGPTE